MLRSLASGATRPLVFASCSTASRAIQGPRGILTRGSKYNRFKAPEELLESILRPAEENPGLASRLASERSGSSEGVVIELGNQSIMSQI